MISIDTYVYHKKEGMFFPINDCPMIDICHLPGRFEFLEGCISIQYYSSEILGRDYWDDIIPLWKNIIDGAETYAINVFLGILLNHSNMGFGIKLFWQGGNNHPSQPCITAPFNFFNTVPENF